MKFSKLILLCVGFLMIGSLMANETKPDNSHLTYVGYEFGSYKEQQPLIGYRYQNGDYIFDIHCGYKYLGTYDFFLHIGNMSH